MESNNILQQEASLGQKMEALTFNDFEKAEAMAVSLAKETEGLSLTPAASAAYARLICRFLLSKKCKSRLPQYLSQNEDLREAVFGRLNTYKYSLVFLLKRVLRQNDPALTREVLNLLQNNPFETPDAKPWADRWSFGFVVTEALNAPADYLNLTAENRAAAEAFLNNSDNWQSPCQE